MDRAITGFLYRGHAGSILDSRSNLGPGLRAQGTKGGLRACVRYVASAIIIALLTHVWTCDAQSWLLSLQSLRQATTRCGLEEEVAWLCMHGAMLSLTWELDGERYRPISAEERGTGIRCQEGQEGGYADDDGCGGADGGRDLGDEPDKVTEW